MTSPPRDGASTIDAPIPPIKPASPPPVARPAVPVPPARRLADPPDFSDTASNLLDQAQTWMEQNQTVAMIGAFALGTFLGIWIRR